MTTSKKYLIAGVIAGPFYILTSILEMTLRNGFDPTRHDWSLLSNGNLGWIHILNFIITGLLVLLVTIEINKNSKWAARGLKLYGMGLIAAGLFVADPMNGFPFGTPDGAPLHPTLHGLLHIIAGALGFIGLITACFVFARRFSKQKLQNWKWFSLITGVVFLASFVGIAGASEQKGVTLQIVTLAFTTAVILSWIWLTLLSIHLAKKRRANPSLL